MNLCDNCLANKVCDHNIYGFENCGNYISTADVAPIAYTVRKMQSKIEKRCSEGGIYPAFVARTVEQVAKEMLGVEE